MKLQLYYVTNRNALGSNLEQPTGYGKGFKDNDLTNLRFGLVKADIDEQLIKKYLDLDLGQAGKGDGKAFANEIGKKDWLAKHAQIKQFAETPKLGSVQLFDALHQQMQNNSNTCDVLVFIHGFNVDWWGSVARALALQLGFNAYTPARQIIVVLFSWPSNGKIGDYKEDQADARVSGEAVGRGLIKLRNYLVSLLPEAYCASHIHLLCHSMGTYLLAHSLLKLQAHSPTLAIPQLFEHIFLCASDVADNALENTQCLASVDKLGRNLTIYHNPEDRALWAADYLKGQGDRLGSHGAAHPAQLHQKVHQVDCSTAAPDFAHYDLVHHDYYLQGKTLQDINQSLMGWAQNDGRRVRKTIGNSGRLWAL